MADADWVDVPLEGLLEKDYAKKRANLMKDTAVSNVPHGNPSGSNGGDYSIEDESYFTTHVSISDRFGNVLSSTTYYCILQYLN